MRRLVLVGILVSCAFTVLSQDHYQKLDYYMYLFAKNIEWPDTLYNDFFYIGVLGHSEANSHLQDLADHERMKDMDIKILVFDNMEDIEFCHLLFLPETEGDIIKKVINKISIHTLVVTELPGSAVKGSGINIHWLQKGNKIHYELNKAAFRKGGMTISRQLLSSSAF